MKKLLTAICIFLVLIILIYLGYVYICGHRDSPTVEPHNTESLVTSLEEESIRKHLDKIKQSDSYRNLTITEKREIIISELYVIADSGTDDYPYALIDKNSIRNEGYTVKFVMINGHICRYAFE